MRWLLVLFLAAPALARAGERCGPNTCDDDQRCVNYGCGTCRPKDDDSPIADLDCPWGEPNELVPGELPSTDVNSRVSVRGGDDGGDASVVASAQRYVVGAGLHLELGADRGGALGGVGATILLPPVPRFADVALTVDATVDDEGAHGAAGFAASGPYGWLGWFAYARWEHTIDPGGALVGGLDAGGGVTVREPYILPCPHQTGCRTKLPLALAVGYRLHQDLVGDRVRRHELDAGLYYVRRGLHVGVETYTIAGQPLTLLFAIDSYVDVTE